MKFGGFPTLPQSNWSLRNEEIKSKIISGAVISSLFYTFQILLQGIHWSLRIHAGLPKIVTLPVGLTSTVLSLSLSQTAEFLLRQQSNDYTQWDLTSTRRRRLKLSTSEIVSDQVSRLVLGLGFFMLLEQSSFRTSLPSSVIRPGVYANFLNRHQRSIVATSEIVSEVERRKMQVLGRLYGCHHCGDRQLFVPKVFIGDHMPPTKFANRISNSGLRKFFNQPVLFFCIVLLLNSTVSLLMYRFASVYGHSAINAFFYKAVQ